MNLSSFLKENSGNSLDSPETTLIHRDIILRKKFLKKLYISWYQSMLKNITEADNGKLIEIGSGGGFIKDVDKRVITSDILSFPHCDMTFCALELPFDNESVSAILMVDVLHHLPDSEKFFSESQRILKPGGKIIMIEPSNTLFSRFIYRNYHHENFDPNAKEWKFQTSGPLSGANGALPWIILNRDYKLFKDKFIKLEKQSIKLHTPFTYLISGGLSYKSVFPGWMYLPFICIEMLFSPLNRWIAMFQTIIILKK